LDVQKRTSMNPITANQEIMLFAGTSFSTREFSPLDNNKRPELNTQSEELERACWAGMLIEILPELPSPFEGSKAFIWNIYSANQFVLIIQGTQPSTIENPFSIDPYCFLFDAKLN